MLTAGLVLAAGLASTAAPAGAQSKKPSVKEAKNLAPLPTSAEPKLQAEAIKGDFADAPPHPKAIGDPNRPSKSAFDPAKSKVVPAETTPTKLTYDNPDGTRTDVLTVGPPGSKTPRATGSTSTWP